MKKWVAYLCTVTDAFDVLMPLADADADLQAKRQCLHSKIEE